ncbi:hypothetical protein F5Y14DRAFT_459796 [Nemania sp. NC0429]|nr:hypothetical protein F5Y14DRAFT_459796 [Nemania sp. NC0429]
MSALTSWILSGPSKTRPSSVPGLSSNSDQGKSRILHGRVTKPVHTKVASKATKHSIFGRDSKNSEKDEAGDGNSGSSSNVAVLAKKTNVTNQEEDSSDESDDDSSDDHQEGNSAGLPLAMAVQQTYSEDGIGSIDSLEDSTDSEANPDRVWRQEQLYLNTILNARNKFTLMPSTWRMHFRGIPLPDSLFYIKMKSKSIRPRIYARTERLEYRGAVALRKLIDVHARIQDIRGREAAVKDDKELDEDQKRESIKALSADIAKQLRRALEQALEWSRQDGELDKYGDQIPPNVKIMELRDMSAAEHSESELRIEREMSNLTEEWRRHSQSRDAPVHAPVVFGFVIMKHIITIVTLDASDPGAILHVPCQLHMAERNQHQWNALAILVTICWARDVALDYIDAGTDMKPVVKDESSDPDA